MVPCLTFSNKTTQLKQDWVLFFVKPLQPTFELKQWSEIMTEHKKHNNVGEKGKLLNEMHKKKNRVILTV